MSLGPVRLEIEFNSKNDRDEIAINAPFIMKDLIKEQTQAAFNNDAKKWFLPLSWGSCISSRSVFGDVIVIGPKLKAWATAEKKRIDWALGNRENLFFDDPDIVDMFPLNESLFGHQRIGSVFLHKRQEALLGDDMGTGKTATILSAITRTPALVICPSAVKRNWAKEAGIWNPSLTPYVIEGTAVQRRKTFEAAQEDLTALVIINYESVRLHSRMSPFGSTALAKCAECDRAGDPNLAVSRCEAHPKELNRIPFQTVIADEAHRIKDPHSKQTRAVWAVMHGEDVVYRWAATGTPIANHPGDLWSILHCISPDQFRVKSKFVNRYCQTSMNPFGGMEILGLNPGTKEEFFKIFHPMFRRVTKAQATPFLPPKVYTTREAEMSPKQAKAYKEMKQYFETSLDSGWLTVPDIESANLIVANRLVQFASSMMDIYEKPSEDCKEWKARMVGPSNKVDAFMEILEEHGDRPIVACAQSRQLIELTSDQLTKDHIPHVVISGADSSAANRAQALADFQEGRVNVLLFTIQAGGTGLTMTRSDTLVFLDRSWSMVDNEQAENRVHRIGSEIHDSVHIIDIVAPGTIEEQQMERVAVKRERAREITGDAA